MRRLRPQAERRISHGRTAAAQTGPAGDDQLGTTMLDRFEPDVTVAHGLLAAGASDEAAARVLDFARAQGLQGDVVEEVRATVLHAFAGAAAAGAPLDEAVALDAASDGDVLTVTIELALGDSTERSAARRALSCVSG